MKRNNKKCAPWLLQTKLLIIMCFKNTYGAQKCKAYRGSWSTAPLILNIGARWKRAVSYSPLSPWPLFPECPFNRKLDGPRCRSWLTEEERSLFPIPVMEARIFQPLAGLLYRVRHPCSLLPAAKVYNSAEITCFCRNNKKFWCWWLMYDLINYQRLCIRMKFC